MVCPFDFRKSLNNPQTSVENVFCGKVGRERLRVSRRQWSCLSLERISVFCVRLSPQYREAMLTNKRGEQ